MSRRPIGPPKGADATSQAARQAVLGSRFRDRSEGTPEPGTPASEASHTQVHLPHTRLTPGSEAPQTPARKRRAEPAGKVRKTYYLSRDTADALERAVEQIRTALGGRIDRHEILGAVITAGTAQTGQIIADMRAELLRTLADETPEASPEA